MASWTVSIKNNHLWTGTNGAKQGGKGRSFMKTSRSVLSASSLALVLLLAGCAGKELAGDAGLAEEHKPEPSHAGEVAMGALKGAGKGAAACAMPTAVGIYAGPIGLIVGGIITIYCLPFGIVAGAVVGGMSEAIPNDQTAALPEIR